VSAYFFGTSYLFLNALVLNHVLLYSSLLHFKLMFLGFSKCTSYGLHVIAWIVLTPMSGKSSCLCCVCHCRCSWNIVIRWNKI